MLKHIVMWKLKDFAEGSSKAENALKIKKELEGLMDTILEIKSLEVGINIENSDSAYDIVLYSVFENSTALDIYQKHPDHLRLAEFVSKVREERVVVDYIVE